jgi:Protein of unknown function (DUF1176)
MLRDWRYLTKLFLASFALLAFTSAYAQPVLERLQIKKDWIFGCDNGLHCEAVALLPSNAAENYLTLKLSRAPIDEAFDIQIAGLSGKGDRYQINVDGRLADTGSIDRNTGVANITNADALKLARIMARGKILSIRDASGNALGQISLAGSAAATRAIDIRQKRAGSKNGMIAIGRSQRLFPTKPPFSINTMKFTAGSVIPDATSLVKLAEGNACAVKRSEVSQDSAYSLGSINGQAAALVLLNCGKGAFNIASVSMVGTQLPDGSWKFEPAKFDSQAGLLTDQGAQPLLVNAVWDQAAHILTSTNYTRAAMDCGENAVYIWDGNIFRLILAKRMDQCRGARDWITLWRARAQMLN